MPKVRFAGLALAGAMLAGCAGSGGDRPAETPYAWTQQGPEGEVSLRVLVPGDAPCPVARVDGLPVPMRLRAAASAGNAAGNPAHAPDMKVTACELPLPAGGREVSVGDRHLRLTAGLPRRIVVVGDTGCRIKVPAAGRGDPIQDCADPAAWPWPSIASAAADLRPDLVIHVGDYHYREYCDDAARCAPLHRAGTTVGYGWDGWQADFFAPARPLLEAAPWVFVRGNHENCDRAGEGWMRFLSHLPYRACPDQKYKTPSRSVLGNNGTADAYRIDFGEVLGLAVADNSGHEDYRPLAASAADLATFRATLGVLRRQPAPANLWLLSHRPIWYDLLRPESEPNAFQAALREAAPATLQLAFSGHQHAFRTLAFADGADPVHYPLGRPAQVIVGGGGTQLEAMDPDSPLYEGTSGPGSREERGPGGRLFDGVSAANGLLLNRHGFLFLERDGGGWTGTVRDARGAAIAPCRIGDGRKELACGFPAR
ncbi:MAG: metallophosphoesterase [Rhodocyclaceae bacterium]|nr:metallophosphoesterase [Rhodocyclaceae bacterium]